jgi:putative oxidoreductase
MLSAYHKGTPAGRRYVLRTFAFMIPYMLICTSMMVTDAFDGIIGKPAGWVLALVVSAPVVGQIWATLSLMRESDEYVRAVIAKQFILAAGLAMAVATFWGFAETFANAPHLPGWLIYAAFWGLYGCVAPLIKASN